MLLIVLYILRNVRGTNDILFTQLFDISVVLLYFILEVPVSIWYYFLLSWRISFSLLFRAHLLLTNSIRVPSFMIALFYLHSFKIFSLLIELWLKVPFFHTLEVFFTCPVWFMLRNLNNHLHHCSPRSIFFLESFKIFQ